MKHRHISKYTILNCTFITTLFLSFILLTITVKPAHVNAAGTYYTDTFVKYINKDFASFDADVLALPEYQNSNLDSLPDEISRAYRNYLVNHNFQTLSYCFADVNCDGVLDLILYNRGYASFVSYDETEKAATEIGYRNHSYPDDSQFTYMYSANPDGPGIFRWAQVKYSASFSYETVEYIDSTNYDNWREDHDKCFSRSNEFSTRIPYKLTTYILDTDMTDCPLKVDDATPTDAPGATPTGTPRATPTKNPTGSLIIMPSFEPAVTTIPPVQTAKPVGNNPIANKVTDKNNATDKNKVTGNIIKSTAKYTILRIDRSIRSADGRVIGALFYDKVVLKGSTKKIKKINKLIEKDCSAFFNEFENRFAEYVGEMVDWHGVDDVVGGGLECSIKSSVKTCNKSLLSIHHKHFWFAGGVSEHGEFGRTYSIKKGKLLRYRDVMKGTTSNIKNVTKYFLRKKAEHIADAFSINTKKDFYVKNNKVYICYNTYTDGGFNVYNGLLGKRSITASKKMIKAAKKPWTYGLKKNTFYVIYGSYNQDVGSLKGNTFTFAAKIGIPYSSQSIPYKRYSFKLAPSAKFYATDGVYTEHFSKATFAARFINGNDGTGVHFKLNSKGQIVDMHYSP